MPAPRKTKAKTNCWLRTFHFRNRSSTDNAFPVAAPSAVLSKMHHVGILRLFKSRNLTASASRYPASYDE